jgi:hypothetical protein
VGRHAGETGAISRPPWLAIKPQVNPVVFFAFSNHQPL